MKKQLKPIMQAMLQARVDGQLTTPAQVGAMLAKYQPAGGFFPADMRSILDFGAELTNADTIPGAKVVAGKYGLDIVY
jgi:hypothetical protein